MPSVKLTDFMLEKAGKGRGDLDDQKQVVLNTENLPETPIDHLPKQVILRISGGCTRQCMGIGSPRVHCSATPSRMGMVHPTKLNGKSVSEAVQNILEEMASEVKALDS